MKTIKEELKDRIVFYQEYSDYIIKHNGMALESTQQILEDLKDDYKKMLKIERLEKLSRLNRI